MSTRNRVARQLGIGLRIKRRVFRFIRRLLGGQNRRVARQKGTGYEGNTIPKLGGGAGADGPAGKAEGFLDDRLGLGIWG